VAAAGDDIRWVAADPGPATLALAAALGIAGAADSAPVLAVSGSATQLTRTQLARLRSDSAVTVVRAVLDGPVPDVDATAAALDDAFDAAGEVILLATALDDADVTDLRPGDAEQLPRALARAVRRVLDHRVVDGIFATGGDVSAALISELGAHGLDVEEEVEPLAVAGTLVGGPWAGLPVVTKGGLVGTADTTVACIEHVRRTASTRRRHVHAAQSRSYPGIPISPSPASGSAPLHRKVSTT
jgi:D-threonate/D-erythronate kinase